MAEITMRDGGPEDTAAVAALFFDAVMNGTAAHYDAAQRRAWAGDAPDPAFWRRRLSGLLTIVAEADRAEADGALIGFMSLAPAGVIDLAYVAPAWMGRGVGGGLYGRIEAAARSADLVALRTEASRAARPFFERRGWMLEAEQTVRRRGAELTNFRMVKRLG